MILVAVQQAISETARINNSLHPFSPTGVEKVSCHLSLGLAVPIVGPIRKAARINNR
jgi:hypothetical protein